MAAPAGWTFKDNCRLPVFSKPGIDDDMPQLPGSRQELAIEIFVLQQLLELARM